jgi:hypothetical protein
VPATYVTEPFDVARGDRCEAVFNVKVVRKLKRKLEAEQAGQPLKKKRKTTKAAKADLAPDSDVTKNIIGSIIDGLITDMKFSDNLTVFDLPFNGVIVNGEELSGDVNANTDTEGCQVVELVFTELQAVESESVEETKRSPKKKYKQ